MAVYQARTKGVVKQRLKRHKAAAKKDPAGYRQFKKAVGIGTLLIGGAGGAAAKGAHTTHKLIKGAKAKQPTGRAANWKTGMKKLKQKTYDRREAQGWYEAEHYIDDEGPPEITKGHKKLRKWKRKKGGRGTFMINLLTR